MRTSHSIPSDVGERMQYLAHNYNDTTIRFLLHYSCLLDSNLLCTATAALVSSVDVLHASFVANDFGAHWQVHDTYSVSDYFSPVPCGGDPMKAAQSLALEPIAYESRCQLHVTLVQNDTSSVVVVRMSHLVLDGSDGKYLLGKLAEAYNREAALRAGSVSSAAVEIKNGSRSSAAPYKDLSAQERRALRKTPFDGPKSNFPFSSPEHGPLQMLRVTIPAETMAAAHQKAKADGATVNDLLLTSCYRSYAKCTHCDQPISISSMMDLRPHCKDGVSEGLTNMSGGMNTVVENGLAGSFSDTLHSISAQTKEVKADPLAGLYGLPTIHTATKLVPLGFLLRASDKIYSSMSLSLTNLGNLPGASLALGGIQPMEGVFAGPVKRKPSVQVGAVSLNGTTELTIAGDFVAEDLPSLNDFLSGMKQEIESYLK